MTYRQDFVVTEVKLFSCIGDSLEILVTWQRQVQDDVVAKLQQLRCVQYESIRCFSEYPQNPIHSRSVVPYSGSG